MVTHMQTDPIRETIWQIVASIPQGRVATYGQVARLAGYPSHARFVGTTLKKLPKGTRLPWFRVVNGKGQLSFSVNSQAWRRQKKLLEAEGILFIGDRFSLKTCQWDA